MGTANSRSVARPSQGGTAWVYTVGVPKICRPDIKKLGHRQGKHRDLTETREIRMTDCSSVRNLKKGGLNFQLQG